MALRTIPTLLLVVTIAAPAVADKWSTFERPASVAVDGNTNVYVIDGSHRRVQKLFGCP